MPQVNPAILVKIGTGPSNVSAANVALRTGNPYVQWSVPANFDQQRFSVLIKNAEPGGFAFSLSGERTGTEHFYRLPSGVSMNQNFEGLCTVEVALSAATGGEYEWISPPTYFCYDRQLEQLYAATAVTLTWEAALDPDGVPGGFARKFHLQIAADPRFNSVVYDNAGIVNPTDPVVTFNVPPTQFSPLNNRYYFFRVRQYDGLDWGQWSVVNAFGNFNNLPPEVLIKSVHHTGNENADVLVTFEVTDANSDRASVAIAYRGAGIDNDEEPVPISTLEPRLGLPVGSHTVTWRTLRDLSNLKYEDVVLVAYATDQVATGPTTEFGPFTIDNRYVIDDTGGVGSTEYTFGVRGCTDDPLIKARAKRVEPVHGRVQTDRAKLYDNVPVRTPKYMWPEAFSLCPLERRRVGDDFEQGWGYRDRASGLDWPFIVVRSTNIDLGEKYDAQAQRIAPATTATEFLFPDPTGYNADGWPTPINSRLLPRTPYLLGYTDANGVVREYPDGYDFTRRPEWHEGREVYALGDAWVQILETAVTHWETCQVCGGKDWLVAARPPAPDRPSFRRAPCPNPTCTDGFDHARPLQHLVTKNPFCKGYADVRWSRLSRWANGGNFDEEHLFGLRTKQGEFAFATQHVVGRSLSSLNAVYKTVLDQQGRPVQVVDYYAIPETGRRLPAGTPVVHDVRPEERPQPKAVTRQPDDGGAVNGGNVLAPREHWHHVVGRALPDAQSVPWNPYDGTTRQPEDAAGTGGILAKGEQYAVTEPVHGVLGKVAEKFFMGMEPTSHPGHARRPQPTQEGGLRVQGGMGLKRRTQSLGFRFLHSYWDSYNTVHWQATVSDTAKTHLQWSKVLPDGSNGPWTDVRGDNAKWDDFRQVWAIAPLVNHAYWDTRSRIDFPSTNKFQLRVRQYDARAANQVYTDFAFSTQFEIIDGVTNPASIIAAEYEPWSKQIAITFRLDDSAGRHYTVTGLSWSDNDGVTWHPVGTGDLHGETHYLATAVPDNVHTIFWDSSSAGLGAGDYYRLALEVTPSDALGQVVLPFFKWLTPINPVIDDAESEITQILGRVERRMYDPATKAWVVFNPPKRVGGLLSNLAVQAELVRQQATDTSPNGAYPYLAPDANGMILGKAWGTPSQNRWRVADQAGYDRWLAEKYSTTETHGQALARIAREQTYYQNVRLPELRLAITAGEQAIRKRLMRQGFYAEAYFNSAGGEVVETITVPAREQEDISQAGPRDVTRWWRFRVQAIAEGPSDVYDADGKYDPKDMTNLERVLYRWQMDALPTFDSQAHAKPLRDRLTNYDGTPLAVASFSAPAGGTAANPTVDDPRSQEGPWTGNTGGTQIGIPAAEPDPVVTTVAGTLKLPPSDLPGRKAGDSLAAGQASYEGGYRWRVASYNPLSFPPTARPRPLITSVVEDAPNNQLAVAYTMQAHEMITEASLTDYQVSTSFLSEPAWLREPATWVSDRRAPMTPTNESRRINSLDWTWPGRRRQRHTLMYDVEQMQYVGFTAKADPNDATGKRTRVVGFRAMELGRFCEYDVYFRDVPLLKVEAPSLVKVGTTYRLFAATQEADGQPMNVSVAASADADDWGDLAVAVEGGTNPSAVFDAARNKYVLFFERKVGGTPQVFVAESDDGAAFGAATQVTSEPDGARWPSAVKLNGSWALYYEAGGEIVSIAGGTPTTLGGRQSEVSTFQHEDVERKPLMPFAFIDRYMGNRELFLCFEAADPADGRTTWVARLEDRQWNYAGTYWVAGAPGHVTSVPASRDGVARQVLATMSGSGINPGDPVKLRFAFGSFAPERTTYLRQGDWSGGPGASGETLDPPDWSYTKLLDSYPYLNP